MSPSVFSASPLAGMPTAATTAAATRSGTGASQVRRGKRRIATSREVQVAGTTGRRPAPKNVATTTARRRTRLAQRLQDELAGALQRVEHADAPDRHRLEEGRLPGVQLPLQV